MSQPADAGGPQQPPTLKETLVEAHGRAQDAISLSGRRIRSGIAAGDIGRVEAAAADLVVSLVQVSEVVSSRFIAGKADSLPTSPLFQSCTERGTVPRSGSTDALAAAFASLGRLPAAADAAGEAPTAQPGPASPARGEPGSAVPTSPTSALPEAAASPLRAGLAGSLRSLQQVPERVNEAITKLIEVRLRIMDFAASLLACALTQAPYSLRCLQADDLSSNAEQVVRSPPRRCRIPRSDASRASQVMRRQPVRTARRPASSSPRKEDAGSPGASPGARSPASPSGSGS
jgi:hypothetical protein